MDLHLTILHYIISDTEILNEKYIENPNYSSEYPALINFYCCYDYVILHTYEAVIYFLGWCETGSTWYVGH
jgi:hypothetical protein